MTDLEKLVREIAQATAEYIVDSLPGLCTDSALAIHGARHEIATAVLKRTLGAASDGDWELWNAIAHPDPPVGKEDAA